MKMMIFGAGFSGQAIGTYIAPKASFMGGTTRRKDKFLKLENAGIKPFLFSGAIDEKLLDVLGSVTHLVQSISPDQSKQELRTITGDPLIPLLLKDLHELMPNLEWIGYLSTVGVYGNHDGAWVDEAAECKPVSARSKARKQAEEEWEALGAAYNLPVAILRLSGIYGPGRNTFINYQKGTARRLIKKDQVFNRIYVEDIARATGFLASDNIGGIFNVTDDLPAPPQDVVAYAGKLLGVNLPDEIDFEDAQLSPMARSFYGENKRVSNAKIKALGFEFHYPDYKFALEHLLKDDLWKG